VIDIYSFNSNKILPIIVRPKLPSPINSISVKIPSFIRVLRRIQDRLRKIEKIIKNTAILFRVSEKLTTEFEIVRYKN
jgi:hypothetical protein